MAGWSGVWQGVVRWILPQTRIDHIVLHRSVLDDIKDAAAANHPKESMALFVKEMRGTTLHIKGLAYQRFESDEVSASFRFDIPLTTEFCGFVHSHPSRSNRPSIADRELFNKNGMVHAIICYPYHDHNIAFYDKYGHPIDVEIEKG